MPISSRSPTATRMAALAQRNVELNDMKGRVAILEGDLLRPPKELEGGDFDHVIANPPYLPPDRADLPPDATKAAANVEGEAGLADWVDFAIRMTRPKGGVTLIHRADRLDELLALFHGRAGGIVVFPLGPRPNREAKRVRQVNPKPADEMIDCSTHRDSASRRSTSTKLFRPQRNRELCHKPALGDKPPQP